MEKSFKFFTVGIIILAVSSCKQDAGNKETALPLIKTSVVGCVNHVEKVEYSGVVSPEEEAFLSFKVGGILKSLPKCEGGRFNKGDIVATLDNHDFKVQYNAAKAVYEQSEKELERVRALYKANTIAPNDYEKTVVANKVAESKYISAKDALMYTEIKAPFDGFVSSIYKNCGEIVSAGMPVICMESDSKYNVDVDMAIKDFHRLESLLYAELSIDDSKTRIKLKSKKNDVSIGQLCRVSFGIPEEFSTGILMSGMNVEVVFVFSKFDSLLSVPATALFLRDEEPFVWRINNGVAVGVPIKIIRIEEDRIFVDGLQSGDKIAVTGVHSISEGQQIEEITDTPLSNIGGVL